MQCVVVQQRGGVAHSQAEVLTFETNNKTYSVNQLPSLTSYMHREYVIKDEYCEAHLYHINSRGVPKVITVREMFGLWKDSNLPTSLDAIISMNSSTIDVKPQSKNRGDIAVSSTDKSDKKRIVDSKLGLKLAKQMDREDDIAKQNNTRLISSQLLQCSKCSNLYIKQRYYDAHVEVSSSSLRYTYHTT